MHKALIAALVIGIMILLALIITASIVFPGSTTYVARLERDPASNYIKAPTKQPLGITCMAKPSDDKDFTDLKWISPGRESVFEGDPTTKKVGGHALRLLFTDPKREDSGIYECTAKHGKDTLKTEVTILFYDNSTYIHSGTFQAPLLDDTSDKLSKVNSLPTFENQYEMLMYEEGSNAEVTCSALGEKPIVYSWFNEREEAIRDIMNPSKYISTSENGSTLFIRPVKLEDEGTYVCKASNKHGLSSKLYAISVIPSISNDTNNNTIREIRIVNVTSSSVLFGISTSAQVNSIQVAFKESKDPAETLQEWKRGDVYIVKNLISAGLYTFQFRANPSDAGRQDNGTSWSRKYEVTLLASAPEVIFQYAGENSIRIEWTRNFEDIMRKTIDKYQLMYYWIRRVNGSTWKNNDCSVTIELASCSGSTYTIAGLSKNTYYELQVRAHTKSGYGDPYKQKIFLT